MDLKVRDGWTSGSPLQLVIQEEKWACCRGDGVCTSVWSLHTMKTKKRAGHRCLGKNGRCQRMSEQNAQWRGLRTGQEKNANVLETNKEIQTSMLSSREQKKIRQWEKHLAMSAICHVSIWGSWKGDLHTILTLRDVFSLKRENELTRHWEQGWCMPGAVFSTQALVPPVEVWG